MSSTATGTSPPTPPPRSSSKTARAASAFKSGVVYGGSALLNGVNAITPHFSGAVDVMVVEQPDGSYKSTPFYVRFGKYTHLRSKDRIVSIYVNGQLAPFHMHLGEYGQAYFTSADLTPEDDDDEEQQSMLAGMMSPPSGYSSCDEDSRPQYANAAILASVQEEVQRLQDEQQQEQAQQQLESSSSANLGDVTLDPRSHRAGSAPPELDSHKSDSRALSNGTGPSSTASSPRGNVRGPRNKVSLPPSTLGLDRLHDGNGGSVGRKHGRNPPQETATFSNPAVALLAKDPRASRLSQPGVVTDLHGLHTGNDVQSNVVSNEVLSEQPSFEQEMTSLPAGSKHADQYQQPETQHRHPTSLLSLSLQTDHHGNDKETDSTSSQPVPGILDNRFQQTHTTNNKSVVHDSSSTIVPLTVGTDNSSAENKPETTSMPTSPFSPHTQISEQGTQQQDDLAMSTNRNSTETGDKGHQDHETGKVQQSNPIPVILPDAEPATQAASSAAELQQLAKACQQLVNSANQDGNEQAHVQNLTRTAQQGLQGLDLSMCGAVLQPGMPYIEAVRLFEAHKVTPSDWVEKAAELLSSPHLIVRLQGDMCPWIQAAPMVMGWAVFGAWWPHLLPADVPRWSPPSGFTPQSSFNASHMPNMSAGDDAKKTSSSSWRIWPFSSNRKPLSGSPPVSGALHGNQLPPRPPSSNANNQSNSPMPPARTGNGFVVSGDVSQNHSTDGARQETVNDSSFSSISSLTAVSAPPQLGVSSGLLVHTRSSVGPNAREPPINLEGVALTSSSMRDLRRSKTSISRKTLSPSKDQLAGLRLKSGQNIIKYTVGGRAELTAYIYFFHWTTRLVISDVDGTITKSDVLGHLLPAMGWDWSHAGISRLFTDIERNNYQLMYLSSRSISQAGITREYLNTLVQGHHRMPVGPVIISPHGLLPSLYREMILRRPHEFKIATLQDIRALFPPEWNPFYAGFGNRDTDEISYRTVGVPMGRIFIINPKGELRKAAVEVQTSSLSSLAAINELVHDIFPPTILQSPLSAVLPPVQEPTHLPLTADELATANADVSTITLQRTPTAPAVVTTTGSGTLALSPAGSGTLDVNSSDNVVHETRSVPAAPMISSADGNTSQQSQKDLLHALQALRASETYNDLAYWSNDPSAYMAGDLEALEKLVVHVTPASNTPSNNTSMSDANSRDLTSTTSRRENLKACESSPGALQGMGSTISDMSEVSEDPPLPRRSRDFIATYNPFAY